MIGTPYTCHPKRLEVLYTKLGGKKDFFRPRCCTWQELIYGDGYSHCLVENCIHRLPGDAHFCFRWLAQVVR